MSKLDEQEKRIAQILSDGVINEDNLWKTSKTLNKYFKYLKNNLDSPCIMTGIESYPWEESYVFGYGSKKEYEHDRFWDPCHKNRFATRRINSAPVRPASASTTHKSR
jgi:hypothetical protein